MKDLPADITSQIVNSIKHDPVYKITYKRFLNDLQRGDDDDDEYTVVATYRINTKYITLSGKKDDAVDLYPRSWFCRQKDFKEKSTNNAFGDIHYDYSFPAWLKVHKNGDYAIIKTEDYLKELPHFEGNSGIIDTPGDRTEFLQIITFERFA
jgi:hypothetical protein